MNEKPVAWKVRRDYWQDGEWYYTETNPKWADAAIPLYAQSPDEARALAIAECAEFCESLDPTLRPHAVAERIRARFGMEQDAPEIFPGTMDALNSLGVRK